jgi:hypothetical protein
MSYDLSSLHFSIDEPETIATNRWKDVSVTGIQNSFSNATSVFLGGLSQNQPQSIPVYNVDIQKLFHYNELLFDYLQGSHTVRLMDFPLDGLSEGDKKESSYTKLEGNLANYSISITAGEFATLSASFTCKTLELSQKKEVSYYEHKLDEEIPKMDRIALLMDIFDDSQIYSITYSEEKTIDVKQPISLDRTNILILESPVITQKMSVSGVVRDMGEMPMDGGIDLIDYYLKQKNEKIGFKVYKEDLSESKEFLVTNPRVDSLSIDSSESDYLLFTLDFSGTRVLL